MRIGNVGSVGSEQPSIESIKGKFLFVAFLSNAKTIKYLS